MEFRVNGFPLLIIKKPRITHLFRIHSIAILPKQGVEFKHIEPICKGDYLEDLPTTSIHGVKGYWTPQLNNQQSTMYTFHVIGDQCVTDSTKNLLIIVNDLPIADAGKDTSIYEGQSINLHGKGGLTYHWYPDTDLSCDHCERPTCSALQTIQYQLEVTDENGCTDIDSVWIFVNQNIDVFVLASRHDEGYGLSLALTMINIMIFLRSIQKTNPISSEL